MKQFDARMGRKGGKWQVLVRNDANRTAGDEWLALGVRGDSKVAVRVRLALLGGNERK